MAGNIIKDKFVKPNSGVNFSRSLFRYEKRHSTNLLAGLIVPVHTQFLYPGSSPDWNFGCVVESAPLISTCLDNIYIDVVSIWTPCRLVMKDWNEFLGESHTTAFTINRNIKIPKLDTVNITTASRSYIAEHYIGPHIGYRNHNSITFSTSSNVHADSKFKNGVSVLQSRIYDLNWNTFFRNENLEAPLLIDTTSTLGSYDLANYTSCLGRLKFANHLKTFYYTSTPAPSLLDVSIALDAYLAPVGVLPDSNYNGTANTVPVLTGGTYTLVDGEFMQFDVTASGNHRGSAVADLSQLTVNRMYYALMEQRFANKMMKGRRAVEFYENFFGVKGSEAGHDLPQLLTHKRFPLNISQVIATASGTNGTETTDLGQRGAFSNTGFGGPLVHNFTATEHGYIQTYVIIRGQPSVYEGIDHYLGCDSLLDFYLPEFDHIGPVGIERLELQDVNTQTSLNYGYTNAWYAERNQVSDVVGIMEPGQPLSYKTLAESIAPSVNSLPRYDYRYMDRIFLFPVCYGTPHASGFDDMGEPFDSSRYQFLLQFAVKGKLAAVMSPDSEPLKMRL